MTTKNLIPRASGEGGIGITDVTWGYGYYDTGNFNKGLFVSGHNITQVIAETVTQGGLGGEWTKAVNDLDIYYNGGNVGIGATSPAEKLQLQETVKGKDLRLRFLGKNDGNVSKEGYIVYDPDSDFLALSSTQAINGIGVDSTGNVGIGTTSPIHALDVFGFGKKMGVTSKHADNTRIDHATLHADLSGFGNMGLFNNVGNPVVQFKSNGDSYINGGNVGIGTTDPSSPLHVSSENANTISLTRKLDIRNSANGAACKIQGGALVNTTPSMGGAIGLALIDSDGIGASTNTEGYLYFETKDSGASLTEKMRIDSAGNVGIGTAKPQRNLDIYDTGGSCAQRIWAISDQVLGAPLMIGAWTEYGVKMAAGPDGENLTADDVADYSYTVGIDSTNVIGNGAVDFPKFKFGFSQQKWSEPGDMDRDIMVLQPNGNVGIGTSSPGAKLVIEGTTNTQSQLKITNQNVGRTVVLSANADAPACPYVGSSTNDSFAIYTNNSAKMLINPAGNVGIGTTSPSAKLEIQGQGDLLKSKVLDSLTAKGKIAQGTTTLYVNEDLTLVFAAGDTIKIEEGLYTITNVGAGAIVLSTNYIGATHTTHTADLYTVNDSLCINSDGNVGIGTTIPTTSLEVCGAHGSQFRISRDIHPDTQYCEISGGASIMQFKSVGSTPINSAHTVFLFVSDDGTDELERMRIDAAGNVGIGTTSPEAKLDVQTDSFGSIAKLGTVDGINNPRMFIGSSATGMYIRQSHTTGAGGFDFQDAGGGSKLFIKESGNVGIGTTNPVANKLHVNGNIFANGTITPTSDDRVKHNEQTIVGAIEILGKLTPKKYIKTTEMYDADHDFELDANGDPVDENGEPVAHAIEAGVIAQKVLEVPELAFTVSPEGVDEDGNVTSPHGLNYNSLFTYAIAAIQEQQQLIEDLRSEVEALKNK